MTAFLDGRPIEVTRAVLAPSYVGYYMVELQIPAVVNRGVSDLRLVMNGVESNRVKLSLEPDVPAKCETATEVVCTGAEMGTGIEMGTAV